MPRRKELGIYHLYSAPRRELLMCIEACFQGSSDRKSDLKKSLAWKSLPSVITDGERVVEYNMMKEAMSHAKGTAI
jgi:hypothetical protein